MILHVVQEPEHEKGAPMLLVLLYTATPRTAILVVVRRPKNVRREIEPFQWAMKPDSFSPTIPHPAAPTTSARSNSPHPSN